MLALLADAEALAAEAGLRAAAHAALLPLAARLEGDAELFPRASEALFRVASVPSAGSQLAARIGRLKDELARQRRLAAERATFAAQLAAFEASVAKAMELTGFPLPGIDSAEEISALQAEGKAQAEALVPAPEGATAEQRAAADELMLMWLDVQPPLSRRAVDCVVAAGASLTEKKLHDEYASLATKFDAWHGRSLSLLTLSADAHAVGAADVLKAVELAEAQLAEGEAHCRRANDLVREMAAAGVEKSNPSSLTLAAMAARLAQVKTMSVALAAAAKAAPPLADPSPVVAALHELAVGVAGKKKESGPGKLIRRLSGSRPSVEATVLAPLPADQAGFVSVEAHESNGAITPTSFDPFPADRMTIPGRPLPAGTFNRDAHAFSVLEQINRARTNPKGYAAFLSSHLGGCYSGTTFSPPWGGIAEGESALQDLIATLNKMAPSAALRLVAPMSECSQQLADEIAAAATAATPRTSGGATPRTSAAAAGSPLSERLLARGKWSGSAGEAVAFGVRQPEAIVAMLLVSDGDTGRRNREFLLKGDLRSAGFGLADHAAQGSVSVITLVTLFARALKESTTVECQGAASEKFQEVLDAIPSQEARAVATDALVQGKKVTLEYNPDGVQIIVEERDGSKQVSRLQWG